MTTRRANKTRRYPDLTAHEATTEKVVHQLVVHEGAAEQRTAA